MGWRVWLITKVGLQAAASLRGSFFVVPVCLEVVVLLLVLSSHIAGMRFLILSVVHARLMTSAQGTCLI